MTNIKIFQILTIGLWLLLYINCLGCLSNQEYLGNCNNYCRTDINNKNIDINYMDCDASISELDFELSEKRDFGQAQMLDVEIDLGTVAKCECFPGIARECGNPGLQVCTKDCYWSECEFYITACDIGQMNRCNPPNHSENVECRTWCMENGMRSRCYCGKFLDTIEDVSGLYEDVFLFCNVMNDCSQFAYWDVPLYSIDECVELFTKISLEFEDTFKCTYFYLLEYCKYMPFACRSFLYD